MKKLFIITAIFFLLPKGTLLGQKLSLDSLRIQKIIDVPNTSIDTLHIMVRKWFESKYFIAEPRIITNLSGGSEQIKGDYTIEYRDGGNWHRAKQTLTIEFKDNLIRITIDAPYYAQLLWRGTKSEQLGSKWLEFKRYDNALKFTRNSWRKNIDSLKEWCLVNYQLSEDEARKNAQFR